MAFEREDEKGDRMIKKENPLGALKPLSFAGELIRRHARRLVRSSVGALVG
jgi:hypothetical protein